MQWSEVLLFTAGGLTTLGWHGEGVMTHEELRSLFPASVDEADEELLLFSTDSLILKVKLIASVLPDSIIINDKKLEAQSVLNSSKLVAILAFFSVKNGWQPAKRVHRKSQRKVTTRVTKQDSPRIIKLQIKQ